MCTCHAVVYMCTCYSAHVYIHVHAVVYMCVHAIVHMCTHAIVHMCVHMLWYAVVYICCGVHCYGVDYTSSMVGDLTMGDKPHHNSNPHTTRWDQLTLEKQTSHPLAQTT